MGPWFSNVAPGCAYRSGASVTERDDVDRADNLPATQKRAPTKPDNTTIQRLLGEALYEN